MNAAGLPKIGRQIGEGNFGEVYEAVCPVHGSVVIKRLKPERHWLTGEEMPLSDAQVARRKQMLLEEGKAMSRARHGNVVQVYGAYPDPRAGSQDVMLSMEFCSGGSLKEVSERGPVRLGRAKRIATNIAHGLQCLHGAGLIHRDIRPSNVLLTSTGRGKLADFGLVTDELIYGYAEQAGYTNHLAKEIHEEVGCSIRSDIWAFGLTVYRLINGEKFYKQQERPALAVPRGRFAAKLRWLEHIPDPWRRFLRKCMHDDRERRCQSATEVLNGLAGLPEIQWECIDGKEVRTWTRRRQERRLRVELNKVDKTWEGYSQPLGGTRGRKVRLPGSGEASLPDFLLRYGT